MPNPTAEPLPGDPDHTDDLRWLVSSAAEPFLLRAAQPAPLTQLTASLRRELSPQRTHLVLEQTALRQRARDKFAAASQMFFSPKGLEQATDEVLARYKAARMVAGARIADLCTGIGGDLLALAARGSHGMGVERDLGLAILAEANLRLAGLDAKADMRVDDALAVDLSSWDAWHVDPDRRPAGHRTTRAELHEPSADALDQLLSVNPHGAIKLAPAAELPAQWIANAELEWISTRRQCRQLVAWFGGLARCPGQARATTLTRAGEAHSITGIPGEWFATAETIGRYVFEPDAAVLAAKLEAPLAEELNLLAVAPEIAYWTGDEAIENPLVACFEVDAVLPFDARKLAAALGERGIGRLEIKVRGVKEDPARLRAKLKLAGANEATVLIAPVGGRVLAILARRAVGETNE